MTDLQSINSDYKQKYGFRVQDTAVFHTGKGLDENVVRKISEKKQEPAWMLEFRLNAFKVFQATPMPSWGADLNSISFDNITYYIKPSAENARSWDDVPAHIKQTFDRLGIPEAEQKFLGGVGAQFESESVYHSLNKELAKKGVIFCDMGVAVKEHPELVKKYFSTVVAVDDNKFAALNSAVWSGGSFVYIPKGVKLDAPLQAYFRINARNMGQFERTLIIADEGAELHYIEGCTAPVYASDSLHAAVVEVIVLKDAKVRYTTIQNWSSDVYNLVTKRAIAHENAVVEWVDGNLGSKATMKYPCVVLQGKNSRADILSIAYAGRGQHQDTGAKVIHVGKETSSKIVSKSISKDNGRASYRGLLRVRKGARNATSSVVCDALLLGDTSRSDTYPTIKVEEDDATIAHEAKVGRIGEDQLFYLMQRGLTEEQAMALVVLGFISDFTKALPLEYSIELNKLIELEMEGSIG